MKLTLVVAVAQNGVIGADGDLAWRISDDLKWFKEITLGKPIVMGRKTFQSIGKALPGRDNIVVTRDMRFDADDVYIARSIDAAIKLASECADRTGADEICVIGGGEIYAQTIAQADRIYLTRVAATVEGDTRFPAIDSGCWRETLAGAAEKGPKNDHDCEFFILDRLCRGA